MNEPSNDLRELFAIISRAEAGDLNHDEITIGRQKNSRVVRIAHPSFPFPVAVKRIREKTGLATLQFEALKRISQALGDGDQFRDLVQFGSTKAAGLS
jgi:hypothetical protein